MYSSNPRRVGIYNTYTWASIHMGSIYSNRSKGNGEDFLNEVMGISQTSHVNIVSLLGFCLEGSKRALIYEYMPMVPWISMCIQSWLLGGKCCSKLLLVLREDWSLASGMQHSHHTFRYQTSKHPSR